MKVDVLDKNGKKVEDISLSKSLFGVEVNNDLLSQYLHIYRTNQRQGTRGVKTRSDVSGGGKKPWRQKGTGRARVGSSRNPLWRHGGVAHGPKQKEYKLSFPKKMKKHAMKCALSFKFNSNSIKVLDKLSLEAPSTKSVSEILKKLGLNEKTLLVINNNDSNIVKSVSNLAKAEVELVSNLNPYQVLNNKAILFLKDSVKELEGKYK